MARKHSVGRNLKIAALGSVAALALDPSLASAQGARTSEVNISAQSLGDALTQAGRQTRTEVIFSPSAVAGKTAPAVQGNLSAKDTIDRLIAGSELSARQTKNGAFVIEGTPQGNAFAGGPNAGSEKNSDQSTGEAVAQNEKGIAEILVVGRKTQNVDIRRTENDSQPYVIFDKKQIQQAGSSSIEDFLKTRLPMNTAAIALDQSPTTAQPSGQINLRGLGSNQTLILVDGRRLPDAPSTAVGFQQASINGIPLAAIERIEVLPATAGAIYGGGATGGVVNVILRHDYRGLDLNSSFGITSRGDAQRYELGLAGGFGLNHNTTRISFRGNYVKESPLYVTDRDFARRAREQLKAANPSAVSTGTFPLFGANANICSATQISATLGICNSNPLRLDNGQLLPGSITFVPPGYGGPTTDAGAALAANGGLFDIGIPDRGLQLLRNNRHFYGGVDLEQKLTSWMTAFANFSDEDTFTRTSNGMPATVLVPAALAENPFQQAVVVSIWAPDVDREAHIKTQKLIADGGFIFRLPFHWAATVEHNWSRSRVRSSAISGSGLTSAGLSLLARSAFQDLEAHPVDLSPYLVTDPTDVTGPLETTLNVSSLRVAGPLLQLPAGPLNLTGLIERRHEELDDIHSDLSLDTATPRFFWAPQNKQRNMAYYLEARVPLISVNQGVPLFRELEVQGSVRRDKYETTTGGPQRVIPSHDGPFPPVTYTTNDDSSTDFMVGMRYVPIRDLELRASYSTGFMPPDITQIVPTAQSGPNGLVDPRRGGTAIPGGSFQFIRGGNPNLQPEESRSVSFGAILTPTLIPDLRMSVDYTRIKKSNEISSVATQFILNNEAIFPTRVIRASSNLPGDNPSWAPPVIQIDGTNVNYNNSKREFIDIQADYALKTKSAGVFNFGLVATHALHSVIQVSPSTLPFDTVGFTGGPLKWKAASNLVWDHGPLSIGWSAQFYNGYSLLSGDPGATATNAIVASRNGRTHIGSQIYNDMFISYRFDRLLSKHLRNTTIALNVENIFDKSPPIIVPNTNDAVESSYSTYADARMRRFLLTLRTSFGH